VRRHEACLRVRLRGRLRGRLRLRDWLGVRVRVRRHEARLGVDGHVDEQLLPLAQEAQLDGLAGKLEMDEVLERESLLPCGRGRVGGEGDAGGGGGAGVRVRAGVGVRAGVRAGVGVGLGAGVKVRVRALEAAPLLLPHGEGAIVGELLPVEL
jgi:hypothetical protein